MSQVVESPCEPKPASEKQPVNCALFGAPPLRLLLCMIGTLLVSQSAFGGKDWKSAQQRARAQFDTNLAAQRAAEKQDWQGAVREYTKLIELLEAEQKEARDHKCSRAIAYTKLGELESARRDLSFEVDPMVEENRGSSTPTICLLARAELEEQKWNLDRAAYYYRLMFQNDCNDNTAARALARLKACPLMAFRVRGIEAKDSLAMLKAIHPDIAFSDTDINSRVKVKSCGRLCRAPDEEFTDSVIRPNPTGGFYVFPGLLPHKTSRCGGTNLQDTSAYLENNYGWENPVSNCGLNPNCPLACLGAVTDQDAGWEVRTVAPDPNHADSILVVDQRNTASGPGAAPGHDAYKLTVTSDGFLAANAPFCARLSITNSQAGAPIEKGTPASSSHRETSRHSSIPGTLRRWFTRTKNR